MKVHDHTKEVNQGKTKEQIKYSEDMTTMCFLIAGALIVLSLIIIYLEKN